MMQRKGSTLAEMVIYMGILSLLLLVFVNMFAVLVNRQLETEELSSTQYDSAYVLARMSYDFGRATTVENPPTAGSASASLRLMIGGSAFDYSASGSALFVTSPAGSYRMNSSETTVTNLTFLRLGPGGTSDVVTAQFDLNRGNDVIHFSSTFGLRDK